MRNGPIGRVVAETGPDVVAHVAEVEVPGLVPDVAAVEEEHARPAPATSGTRSSVEKSRTSSGRRPATPIRTAARRRTVPSRAGSSRPPRKYRLWNGTARCRLPGQAVNRSAPRFEARRPRGSPSDEVIASLQGRLGTVEVPAAATARLFECTVGDVALSRVEQVAVVSRPASREIADFSPFVTPRSSCPRPVGSSPSAISSSGSDRSASASSEISSSGTRWRR